MKFEENIPSREIYRIETGPLKNKIRIQGQITQELFNIENFFHNFGITIVFAL